MKSTHWLDQAKTTTGIESDNRLAALLGMTRSAISNHRQGISTTLKDEHAYKIEALLNLPHGKIVLDQHAEREKNPDIAAMWRKLAATAAAIAVIFFQLNVGGNALPHLEINPLNSIAYGTFT